MRLGLLGPAGAKVSDLARGARFLYEDVAVDRAIYLGVDAALDSVVRSWAEKLVKGDPGDPALWRRAADRCVSASSAQIDAFLSAEQERRALKLFQSLPGDGTRVIELLNGKVVVMIYDKADLDEAMQETLKAEGPALLEVMVTQDENCYPMIPPMQAARDMVGGPEPATAETSESKAVSGWRPGPPNS